MSDSLTDLVVQVFRVNGQLLAAGDELTKPFGQSSSRWQVMGALSEAPSTVSDIARSMGLTRQSVQRTVDLLVKENVCELVDNPSHARSSLVKLTREGEMLLEKISAKQAKWVKKLGNGIREKEIKKALLLLETLSRKLN